MTKVESSNKKEFKDLFNMSKRKIIPKSKKFQVFLKNLFRYFEVDVFIETILLKMRFSRATRKLLDYLIELSKKYEIIYPSQVHTLAPLCGVTNDQISRIVGALETVGVLKVYQMHNASCFYRLHPLFFHKNVRKSLSSLLPSLRVVLFGTLAYLGALNSYPPVNVEIEKKFSSLTKLSLDNKTPVYLLRSIKSSSGDIMNNKGDPKRKEITHSKEREIYKGNAINECPGDIAPFLANLRKFGFTHAGLVWLSMFSERSVRYALEMAVRYKRMNFNYIWTTAMNYCRKSKFPVKWKAYYALRKKYGYTGSEEMMVNQVPVVKRAPVVMEENTKNVAAPQPPAIDRMPKRGGFIFVGGGQRPRTRDDDYAPVKVTKMIHTPIDYRAQRREKLQKERDLYSQAFEKYKDQQPAIREKLFAQARQRIDEIDKELLKMKA